jgi:hypothetical protein
MNAKLDPTLTPAFDAIFGKEPKSLDKRQLLDRLQKLDYEMRLRHYPPVIEAEYERDAAEFFEAEQAYHGSDRR